MSFCSKCGVNVKDEYKFCINCGNPASDYYKRASNPIQIDYSVNPETKPGTNVPTSIIIDEPNEEDAPDFKNYSKKLSQIILNSKPRFTAGIFGGWGTGKTTLMQMIKRDIDDSNFGNRKKWTQTVWFDAWRYENEKYSAMIPLIRTIILNLKDTEEKTVNNKKKEILGSLKKKTIKILEAIIRNATVSLEGGLHNLKVGTSFNIDKILDDYKSEGSTYLGQEKINFHEHITDHLKLELERIRAEDDKKIPEEEKIDFRLVIFVDDLDRCVPQRSMEILESIKTFFDIKGIVYVIGMDPQTIDPIIQSKYGDKSEIDGLHYLQKIVQLQCPIPLWGAIDLSRVIKDFVTKTGLSYSYSNQILEYKELIIKATELNPRDIKRFINSIVLAKEFYGQDIDDVDKIIAIQAFYFHGDKWTEFLNLIKPYIQRIKFLSHFILLLQIKEHNLINLSDLAKLLEEDFSKEPVKEHPSPYSSLIDEYKINRSIHDIYDKLVKNNDNKLFEFLKISSSSLLKIDEVEKYLKIAGNLELSNGKDAIDSKEQLKLLRSNKVKEINDFAKKSVPIHLPYADLSNLKLEEEAHLNHAFFFMSNLSGANLVEANLSGANLVEANLSGANLVEANLSGSDLSKAHLVEADLVEANLIGADLVEAHLIGADLSEANLSWTNLSEADLSGANLSKANLSKAILSKANLSGADLSEAHLIEANLSGANLIEANLSGANLVEANLVEANLSEANLSWTNLSMTDLSMTDLSMTDLSMTDLSMTDLSMTDLSGANLSMTDLSGANLSKANLSGANLSGANLSKANLSGANLSKANLSGANLSFSLLLNLNEYRLREIKIDSETIFTASLIDGNELLQKISSSNKTDLPTLMSSKQDLKKDLLNRGYSEFYIDLIVESSRCK